MKILETETGQSYFILLSLMNEDCVYLFSILEKENWLLTTW